MKFLLSALVVILTMVFAASTLAEDITPAPSLESPTSAQTLALNTPSTESTWTIEPETATIETTPTSAQATTPAAGVTAMPGAPLGNITGTLVNETGGIIPEGQNVTLVGLDQDQSGTYQKTIELQAFVNPDGSYSFLGVGIPLNRAFLIITSFGGVEFQSDPVFIKDTTTNLSIPITIYGKTNDFNALTMDQVHLKFDLSVKNVIRVTELYIVTNPGKQVVVVTSDGKKIPFLQTPVGATSVQYQLAQGSAQLLNSTGGFALLPGTDKQYGFLASFTLPYIKRLNYEQSFNLPVSSLTVFIPQGMRLSGEQFTAAGTQTIQNQSYLMYQTNKMAAGSSLSLTLSGKPGGSTGFQFNRQTIVLISIVVVGLLLFGVGIYLYLHDRARLLREEQEERDGQSEADAFGENHLVIMDAIIALDGQYKTGEIPKEAYEKRRMELKERLKGSLSSQG